jgi:hypothetical protein
LIAADADTIDDMGTLTEQDIWQVAAPIGVELLGRRVQGIPSGRTRVLYLNRQLEDAPTLPLVRLIACAQRESAAGVVEARVLTDTFGAVVSEGLMPDSKVRDLAVAATELCEHGVLNLVQPAGEDDVVYRAKGDDNAPRGSLAADGETLGRRKTLGRTATGDLLDRVMRDPHPDVIANVMFNPRLNEELCVRLASRRPIKAELLDVIAKSKWRKSPAVRRAIVMNPNADGALACQLVSTLTRAELLSVAHDETLSAEVREAARLLIQEKPPRHIRDTNP